MNLVSVLIAPAIVQLSVGSDANSAPLRYGIALVAVVVIIAAVAVSKRRTSVMTDEVPAAASPTQSAAV